MIRRSSHRADRGGVALATQPLANGVEPEAPADPTVAPGAASAGSAAAPSPPETLEDAGLSEELVAGLVLKALHAGGAVLGFDLLDMLALPMALLDGVIERLQERRLVEVHATRGPTRGEYAFKLTAAGRTRASEELELCRYVGPAPVPFEEFRRSIELQSLDRPPLREADLRRALEGLVLPDSMLDLLGPALNSGRSLFLHGGPGDGKTLLAERLARAFGDRYYVPYSVLVDGSVMIVHDPVHHRAAETAEDAARDRAAGPGGPDPADLPDALSSDMRREIVRWVPDHDRRYALALRPVVVTGGELTLEQLDLQWDPSGRMYQAPPHVKAAGGVLIVDDLGRQRVPVGELLNRWVIPLEQRMDYLTLRSGRTIAVPFDAFVIFSTNLEPRQLADEAFLRRIHYKVEVPPPDRGQYERIFRTCCEERGIDFDGSAVQWLFDEVYSDADLRPRRCHPRDVLEHVLDLASYRGRPATLSPELLERACHSYFLPSS